MTTVDSDAAVNLPNALTVAGQLAGIAWLCDYGDGWGLVSILLDEVDGRIARASGQTSEFGRSLDLTVDLTLLGAVAVKTKTLPALVPMTLFSAHLQQTGQKPSLGSARAILMLWDMVRRRAK